VTPEAPRVQDVVDRLAAERTLGVFLVLHDTEGAQRIVALPPTGGASIGRDPANEVSVDWDERVSRLHARLEFAGGEWTIADDGLSRNGTYVNGERVAARRRLRHGDQLRVGHTTIAFNAPPAPDRGTTLGAGEFVPPRLTEAQRRVLIALCRPCVGPGRVPPATNPQIAAELTLSIDAVKTHLRAIAEKFELSDLPQNVKRTRLVERAIDLGVVTMHELAPDTGSQLDGTAR
jgi:FHA domain